jgi:hypothetical protein
MDVLQSTISPALITDTNLHDLVVGRVARLSLAHGNSDASSLAYVRLATMLGRRFWTTLWFASASQFDGRAAWPCVQGSRKPELRGVGHSVTKHLSTTS